MTQHLNLLGTDTVTYNATVEEARLMLGIPDFTISMAFTLNKDSWSGNQQTITIEGLETTGYAYVVAATPGSTKAYATAGIVMQDVTVANTAIFIAEAIPTVTLTGYILRFQEVS